MENSVQPPKADRTSAPSQDDKDLDALRSQVALIEADDRKAADAVDRIILIGGPAAILTSLSFMKDLAPVPTAGSVGYLLAAWAFLLIGAICGMVALFTTRKTAWRLRRLFQAKIEKREPRIAPEEYDHARRWNDLTRWMNRLGVSGFLIGIAFLLAFATINLPTVRGGAQGTSTTPDSLDALIRQCRRAKCVIYVGYDYDLPAKPASKTSPAPSTKGTSK